MSSPGPEMAAFLPLLQMRAHMMASQELSPGPRTSLGSTGAGTDCSSSPPTPTPLSPLAVAQLPGYSAQLSHNQLYLNQLAAINLHLQQRRLLSSTGAEPELAAKPELVAAKQEPLAAKAVAKVSSQAQEEPMDLSKVGGGGKVAAVFSFDTKAASPLSSSSRSRSRSRSPSPDIKQEAGQEEARPALSRRSSRSSLGSEGRKRSRSSSHEELKFTEDDDDEVFEKNPLPPPSHAFRLRHSVTTSRAFLYQK